MRMCETSVVLICETTRAFKGLSITQNQFVLVSIVGSREDAPILGHVVTDALSVRETLGHFPTTLSRGWLGGHRPIEEDMGLLYEDTRFVDDCVGSWDNGNIREVGLKGFHQLCERRGTSDGVSYVRIPRLVIILLDKDTGFSGFGGRDHKLIRDEVDCVSEVLLLPDFMESTEFFGGNGTSRHFGRRLRWLDLTNPF
jgi:hypothetical protein